MTFMPGPDRRVSFLSVVAVGPVAQLVEHGTFNLVVVGSSPTGPTNRAKVSAAVE